MKVIEVVIDENGKYTLETSGFSGRECLLETEKIRKLLGDSPDIKIKPEAFRKKYVQDNKYRNK